MQAHPPRTHEQCTCDSASGQRRHHLPLVICLLCHQASPLALPAVMKQFDSMQARRSQGAAMSLLGFGELQALCSRVVPDMVRGGDAQGLSLMSRSLTLPAPQHGALRAVGAPLSGLRLHPTAPLSAAQWAELEGELVRAAVRLKARNMRLPRPGASQSGLASWASLVTARGRPGQASWRRDIAPRRRPVTRLGFDLPSELVALPEWQTWLRRMRDAVIAWQLEQHKQPHPPAQQQQHQPQQQQQEAGTGSSGSSTASPVPKVTGKLNACFTLTCLTPDTLPMRQELRIVVAPPAGKELLRKVGRP